MTVTQEQVAACRRWLEVVVDVDCRSGADEQNILQAIEEIILVETGGPLPALFEEMAARVKVGLEAHAREEATWSERTVNDRIDAAFEDLDARGILARQALGSTIQEGAALIDELAAARAEPARGSVFYHHQDLERGVAGEGLLLAFTAYDTEATGVDGAAIAAEILHVLKHHGVPATWDANPRSRIEVAAFAWQKRRSTKAPAGPGAAPPLPARAAQTPVVAVCQLCNGKGWLPQASPTAFPELCVCKGGSPRAR